MSGTTEGMRRRAPRSALAALAGVRLLLAAYEEAQAAAELGPGVLGLLPLSQNVLSKPDEALELLELA